MVASRSTASSWRRSRTDDLRSAICQLRASLVDTGIGLLTVRLHGEFIGYCGLTVTRASIDEPEIAYELLRRTHGDGYGYEAGCAVVGAAEGTGRRRLWASVRWWNEPSFRVLDKLGFERTAQRVTDDFGDMQWCTRALR